MRLEEYHLSAPLAGPSLEIISWDSVNDSKSARGIRILENHRMLQFIVKRWTWAVLSPSSASAPFRGLLVGCFRSLFPSRRMLGQKVKK